MGKTESMNSNSKPWDSISSITTYPLDGSWMDALVAFDMASTSVSSKAPGAEASTKSPKQYYKPVRIIYNSPATIVFWSDGTKTVVKKRKGERFNEYNAFCAALAKKVFESNSAVNKIVKSGTHQD